MLLGLMCICVSKFISATEASSCGEDVEKDEHAVELFRVSGNEDSTGGPLRYSLCIKQALS